MQKYELKILVVFICTKSRSFMHMFTIAPLQIIENLCKQSETIPPFHTHELERSVHNRNVLQWSNFIQSHVSQQIIKIQQSN